MAEAGGGVAVLSSFLSVAIETLTDRDHKRFLKHWNINQGLIQELKTKMTAFGLIVDAAEEKQFVNEGVRKWLLDLKDATYEAEDVLDGIQIEYQARQSKAVTEDQEGSSISQDPLKQEIEPKLQEILVRLEDLRQESDAFGFSKAVGDAAALPRSFEFDVFLNFRGEDVRYGFLHYLKKDLEKEGIKVFYDAEDLGKGEDIDNILEKIEVSKMSVMIFSKDYASSSYCLEELVKILECKKTWGHKAVPVFYHVPPDVVANQSGIYAGAFGKHENDRGANSKQVLRWRKTLKEAAELSGLVLENKRPEENDIQEIVAAVKKILEEFDSEKPPSKGRKGSYSEFLGLKKCMEERSSEKRETTSMIDKSEGFYGRDADKKAIMDMLISVDDNGSNPGVIPIVGMGGVGKTTLAQHVFNDKAAAEQFKVREWVCVSDQFDVTNVTKNIVEKVTKTTCPTRDLDQLQRKLNDALDGKKFLLVLDDIWSEDYEKWRQLLTPLRSGAKGSKLIITTRSKDVASTVQTVPPRYLRGLKDEDCWQLFARHACLDVNSAANHPELEAIGKEIVRKCRGLPLAAKALGGVLRCETKAEKWKEVLKREIWEVQNANILPPLAMSYIHLPSHLKRCFAYCAIFPQAYEFEKEELVALWMAERFFVQRKGKKSLEEIGDTCFDDLVSRSFFQHSGKIWGVPCFAMHDLVHDLARFVSEEFCSRLEWGTSSKIGERTRHLFYQGNKDDRLGIHETPFLRSFVLARKWGYLNKEFIDGLLRTQKLLKVLSLPDMGIRVIPNSIGNLKYMRYLNLSRTSIRFLPEAVTDLFNLEILILRECRDLVELPADMARLINLCQLDLSATTKLKGMPPEMGKLKKLSKLSDFVVGGNGGSSIKELGNLPHLRGEITIGQLQNVKDDRDASEAILKDKENLKVLGLKWDWAGDSRQAKQVLERLQPHTDIESVKIYRYGGREFPNWVGGISFSKLKELQLFELRNCIRLPPLGQLASLEKLSIRGDDDDDWDYYDNGDYNDELEAISVEFYGICKSGEKPFSSLKRLYFSRLKNWREWSSCKGAFPLLEELELRDCPQLMSVCRHLPSLKRLRIENCGEVKCISLETFPNLEELDIWDCFNLESLVGSTAASTTRTSDPLFCPTLTSLHTEGCSKLVSFLRGLYAPNLKRMARENCGNLKWLPQGMHSLLPSLEELVIFRCPEIESFPEGGLPSKLQYIEINKCEKLVDGSMECRLRSMKIKNCGNLKSLPQGMYSLLSSLEMLELYNCPELRSVPSHLPSLKRLRIEDCGEMKLISLETFPNLEELYMSFCSNLVSLVGSTAATTTRRTSDPLFCPSLARLVIVGCSNLHVFPEEYCAPQT